MENLVTIKKLGPQSWSHLEAPAEIILAGYVDNYEEGGHDSDKGIWYRFRGQFEAQFDDAEGQQITVRAVQLFLPDVCCYQLKGAVDAAKSDDEKARVEFAVKVGKRVVSTTQSPCGWEWYYSPIVKMGEQRSLIETIAAKALEEAKTPEPVPETAKKNRKGNAKV